MRQKSHKETANIPSQDQLQTTVDVSVQYRLSGERAPRILQETGRAEDVVDIHLVPKLRSLLREQEVEKQKAEIERINHAIGDNPSDVKLQAPVVLQSISKDLAAKVYFLNGDSPTPLPLMHLGENARSPRP